MHQSPHHNAELLLPLSFLAVWEVLMVSCGSRPPQLGGWGCWGRGSSIPVCLGTDSLRITPSPKSAEGEKVLAEVAAKLLLCALLTRAYRAAQIIHCSVAPMGIKITTKIFTVSSSNFSWKRTFKVSVLKLRRLLSTSSCRGWIQLSFHI